MAKTDLRGKVVFITGAARGIGEETARRAAARGAHVAAGRDGARAPRRHRRRARTGPHVGGVRRHRPALARRRRRDHDRRPRRHRRGRSPTRASRTRAPSPSSPADVDRPRVMEVNLIGVSRTVSATVAAGDRSAAATSCSSPRSRRSPALPGMAAYCGSKAGVEHYGNALRFELAHTRRRGRHRAHGVDRHRPGARREGRLRRRSRTPWRKLPAAPRAPSRSVERLRPTASCEGIAKPQAPGLRPEVGRRCSRPCARSPSPGSATSRSSRRRSTAGAAARGAVPRAPAAPVRPHVGRGMGPGTASGTPDGPGPRHRHRPARDRPPTSAGADLLVTDEVARPAGPFGERPSPRSRAAHAGEAHSGHDRRPRHRSRLHRRVLASTRTPRRLGAARGGAGPGGGPARGRVDVAASPATPTCRAAFTDPRFAKDWRARRCRPSSARPMPLHPRARRPHAAAQRPARARRGCASLVVQGVHGAPDRGAASAGIEAIAAALLDRARPPPRRSTSSPPTPCRCRWR